MAGVYVHIPFCRRACHYCDFHFTTHLKGSDSVVEAILLETELRKDYLEQEAVSTIYFGGGTPSLLPARDIEQILTTIAKHHSLESDIEITLEANPEDLNVEKLKELQSLGINRLSLGTQSFIDAELKWMNRMHSAEQAVTAIESAQKLGFNNISIDLIFGLPGQSKADWELNLSSAIKLNVQHISSYSLTVEKKTVLSDRIKKGLQTPPDDDVAMQFFRMNMEWLPANGFEHYEISNFAKEGFISRHNSSYWQGVKYLGLGPSAHSYNLNTRQWNVRSNRAYESSVKARTSFFETEELAEIDRLNELLLTGLRTKWGVKKHAMQEIKAGAWNLMLGRAEQLGSQYFLVDDSTIRLADQGKLLADRLTSELFFD